ncbi:uncharacterized protein NECHADRAFT_75587 [Fusarium vanettenii 77-13-4]|uniref:Uncharacterized protein n=1 Tax=Fusarium vanettenii (strain ATCC MYA-4622 / CBS 123669 / FGSC 9596 / NRRL 45880 / 77-13-4) TaxID=660122 RepID=C7YJ81_FUSV7|nr:uncharacterized protein NECHADRAFT_75587 [Fusarium vanettenii 77-13-4]EEU48225.1 predicted protein [Fusarium vanettenii 77-13-4]
MAIPHSPTSRHSTSPPTTHATKSLPYRHVPAGSNSSSTTATSIKRSRPGTPANRQSPPPRSRESSGAYSYITPAASDDEVDDSLDDSGSDESDVESCCGDQHDENILASSSHRFQHVVQPLLDHSLRRVREYIDIAQYDVPSDKQEPPRKRSRSSNWQSEPSTPSNKEHSDEEFVVVSPPRGKLRFSCPFYASNTQKHQQCLKKHDLVTLDKVVTHVQRHHMRAPYCPICSQVFDSVGQCDNHIIRRECELRELVLPEGINYYQKAKLARDDKPNLSNKRRWERINATVFPSEKSLSSPYLDRGLGLEVSMARDYWEKHGRTVVSDFLKEQGTLGEAGQDDERAQAALLREKEGGFRAEDVVAKC